MPKGSSGFGRVLGFAIAGAVLGVVGWLVGVYALGSVQAGHPLSSREYPNLAPLAAVLFAGPVGAVIGAVLGARWGRR
jgi:hypothetical protein